MSGTNITTYMNCIYNSVQRVYDNGGRYFVLMNIAPLNLAPMYAAPPYDLGALQYWQDKPKNHTLINQRMLEQVVTVNSIYEYRTPFEAMISRKYPGAQFALYDVHGLVSILDLLRHTT